MQKHYIKKSLIQHGKQLFSQYGLQKTTISDITKKVGIATGTFYNYYQSKEELYFDILEKEEEIIKKQFTDAAIEQSADPKQSLKKLLLNMIHTIETNPLIRQLYFDNNMDLIISKLPQEKLAQHFEEDSEALLPLIRTWQEAGIIVKKNPETLAGVLRALFVLTLHEKEIGEAVYQETIEWYIDQIVESLIKEEE